MVNHPNRSKRLQKLSADRLTRDAGAYLDERLAHASDPEEIGHLLIGDREFVLTIMAGFAAKVVAREMSVFVQSTVKMPSAPKERE